VLSYWNKHWLMIGSRVDRRELVEARRKPTGDISCQYTILRGGIQSLEEGKSLRIGGSRLIKRGELLYHNMRVANNLSLAIHLLWSCKIIFLCVDKGAGLEILHGHADGESCRRLDSIAIFGKGEFGRGHVVGRWNNADRRGIA
jgi:hypothetical protein